MAPPAVDNISRSLGRLEAKADAAEVAREEIIRKLDIISSQLVTENEKTKALEVRVARIEGERAANRWWLAGLGATIALIVTGIFQLLDALFGWIHPK